MANANDPPLAFGEIIDRIEQMREELLMLQRSLEKVELADTAASWGRKWDQGCLADAGLISSRARHCRITP
jgi:hypothetical protein